MGELTAGRLPGEHGKQLGITAPRLVQGPVQSHQTPQRTAHPDHDAPPRVLAHCLLLSARYPRPMEGPGETADGGVGVYLTPGGRFITRS